MSRNNLSSQAKIFSISLIAFLFFLALTVSASALTISDVVVSPSQTSPGETARITVTLENNFEDDIENVNVGLDFSSATVPVAPYGGSSEGSIESIDSNDEEKISFNVIILPEAASGVYKIPIKVDYRFVGQNQTFNKTGTISIVVNSPPKIRASAEGNLIKGSESEMTIKIINDGLSDVKLASVVLGSAPGLTIKSNSYEYVGNIDSNDFDSIDAKIFVEEDAVSYISLPVFITYKDATNKDFSQTETLSLKAHSQEEAKRLGLVSTPNRTLYFVLGAVVVLYVIYRIRKSMKKRRAQGA